MKVEIDYFKRRIHMQDLGPRKIRLLMAALEDYTPDDPDDQKDTDALFDMRDQLCTAADQLVI